MRNFFKVTLTSTALLLGSASVVAESATVPEFGAIFQMKTADQASVAAAFVQFAQSECRQQAPTAIRIMAETFNGTEEPTHSIIWNFPDASAMEATFQALGQCRAWADAGRVLSQHAEFTSQLLVKTLVTGGDYTKDSAYVVWQLSIADEAAYVAAYKNLRASQESNGIVSGAYGLWRVQGGANSEVTHIAFAGAPSLAALLNNSNPSPACVDFQKKVAGIRKVHRMNINRVLADL